MKKYDIVRNPKRGNCTACVITQVPDDRYDGFILSPFTKRGYPSISIRKLIYLLPAAKIYPWTKEGADKRLRFCPECKSKLDSIFYNPMRQLSIYDNKRQCKNCKKVFSS